jgi:hypothetical protein
VSPFPTTPLSPFSPLPANDPGGRQPAGVVGRGWGRGGVGLCGGDALARAVQITKCVRRSAPCGVLIASAICAARCPEYFVGVRLTTGLSPDPPRAGARAGCRSACGAPCVPLLRVCDRSWQRARTPATPPCGATAGMPLSLQCPPARVRAGGGGLRVHVCYVRPRPPSPARVRAAVAVQVSSMPTAAPQVPHTPRNGCPPLCEQY